MLSDRFTTALVSATSWHADQLRKGKPVPYVAHLLIVAGRILDDGGDEDQAIAGLLHDTLEDTDVEEATIRAMFGDEVTRIVVACSDAREHPKPPWLARKQHHLASLAGGDVAIWRVTAADKLHNCADTVGEVRRDGPAVFDRFRGGRQGTCWYYGAMWALLDERFPGTLTDELGLAARALHQLAGLTFPAAPPGR